MSLTLQAPCIDQLHLHVGREVVSQMRVSKVYSNPDMKGGWITVFEIDDASGFIKGRTEAHPISDVRAYTCPFDALVQGRIVQAGDDLECQIIRVEPLDPRNVLCASALLRQRWCPVPARASLLALVKFEKSLQGSLRTFVREVIQDPEVGENLLTCRASAKHHHSFSGGLLVHSTDLFEQARALATQLLPDEPMAPALTQLGYLLHDLGKLRSVGALERPWPDKLVRHEISTLMILEPFLHELKQKDPDAAAGLLYILDYVATPREARRHAEFLGAEIVVFLDQLSAASARDRSLAAVLRKRESSGYVGAPANDPTFHMELSHAQRH